MFSTGLIIGKKVSVKDQMVVRDTQKNSFQPYQKIQNQFFDCLEKQIKLWMQTEDQTDPRQLLPLKEWICLLLLKKLNAKRPNSYLQRLSRVLVGKQHQVAQETFLCMLCALCWQSWGWKYLRYGPGEDVTWLVGPDHCYPGFKVSTARGEMLNH